MSNFLFAVWFVLSIVGASVISTLGALLVLYKFGYLREFGVAPKDAP